MSILTIWKLSHTYVLTFMAQQVDDSTPKGTAMMIELQGLRLSVIDIGDTAATRATKFRYECMTEDMIYQPSSIINAHRISRIRYFNRSKIAKDGWNNNSIHIVVCQAGKIVGSIRICFAKTNKLPFLDLLGKDSKRKLSVNNFDVEISKLFVKRKYRRTYVTSALLFASEKIIRLLGTSESGRIFADVPLGLPDLLNLFTYEKAGFERTGVEYFDHRYKALSTILSLQIQIKLPEYRQKIERHYRRSVHLPKNKNTDRKMDYIL